MHYTSILFLSFSIYAVALPVRYSSVSTHVKLIVEVQLVNKIGVTPTIALRHTEMGAKSTGFNPDWRRDPKGHIDTDWKRGEETHSELPNFDW